MNKNIVAFKQGFNVVPDLKGKDNRHMVMTINAELMQFGYMLSQDAFDNLIISSKEFLVEWSSDIINYLKKWLDKSDYKAFYNNFPKTVVDKSTFELLWDMVTTYWTTGNLEFDEKVKKEFAFEPVEYTIIHSLDEEGFKDLFKKIVQVGIPLTKDDFSTAEWFVKEYKEYNIPKNIPLKENLCMLAALGVDVPVKTPTDVLRIAVYMSTGKTDLILPQKRIRTSRWSRSTEHNPEYEAAKFKKFSRPERRYILGLLDKVANESEMVLKLNRWIRLGEILHPGEYAGIYPNAADAFYQLRNNKVRSWYGKVDEAFNTGFTNGLLKLQERPGEFARRLDALLRGVSSSTQSTKKVLNAFSEVASKVSNKVLLELVDHFNDRRIDQTSRRVFIPGARVPQSLPLLKALPSELVDEVEGMVWEALKIKFASLKPLGKVWIDPELKKIPMPSGMKTLNDSLKPVIRGMRVPLQLDKDTLRVGVFYHNARTGQCIDLSARLTGRGARKIQLNWTTKKHGDYALHSGDSYGRTGNVSEFMDFHLPTVLENGYKYITVFMHNYGRTTELEDNAIVGFQGRQKPDANRDWKQDTVEQTMKLQGLKHKVIYCVIDVSTREYIIVDEDNESGGITVDDKFLDSITQDPKFSVYDLMVMHAESRGAIVEDIEDANISFMFDQFSQSYKQILEFML